MYQGIITYGLNYPIVLTKQCNCRCGFCPWPVLGHAPLLSIRDIEKQIRRAQMLGATMVDFTAGEDIKDIPEIVTALDFYRLRSLSAYLIRAADAAYSPRGSYPLQVRLDIGPLEGMEWEQYRAHFLCAKLLLTSVEPSVVHHGALANAPTQAPEVRLQSIIDGTKSGVPLTTGIMVGIGESAAGREKAIKALATLVNKYGNIQSVLIQAFRPHPATPMAHHPPTDLSTMLQTAAVARHYIPPTVRVQINALDWPQHLESFIAAGVNDLGDLNLDVLAKKGNPQQELNLLLDPLIQKGYLLRARSALMGMQLSQLRIPKKLRHLLPPIMAA
jgi:FO synthase